MTDVTATEASRNFADLLDAIEHEGAEYTILRRGRPVARLAAAPTRANGAEVKRLLAKHPPDERFAADIRDALDQITVDRLRA